MKALIFKKPNFISVQNVPKPEICDGELLVRVKSALICGTDIRILRGKKLKGVRQNSILGHEFSGVVEEIGNDVNKFEVGDAISVAPVIPCLNCYYCKRGLENLCENRTALGYEYNGSFAEYIRIPAVALESGNVFKIPETLPIEDASLAESLACCINGQNKSPIKLGNVVVIFGAGPIGLMHILLAKASGGTIILSEPNEHRRKIASELGANITIDPNEHDLEDIVLNYTNGIGADVVIMAIGVAGLVNLALKVARKGGYVNLFAGFSIGDMPPTDVNIIHYKELKVTGTSASTRKDHELALNLIKKRIINPCKIVSHQFKLEQAIEAFEFAENGKGLKIAILP